MRPQFEKVPLSTEGGSLAFERVWPKGRFDGRWHFHPEVELTLILEGRGRRVVGDHLESFVEGDLVLIGANLPHFWQTVDTGRKARAVVVQFSAERCGLAADGPVAEWEPLRRLVAASGRGLKFPPSCASRIGGSMKEMVRAETPADRLIALLTVLSSLAGIEGRRALASVRHAPTLDRRAEERLQRVYSHVLAHLQDDLSLASVAKVAGLSREGFSRYFKRATGRWFSDFLGELRVQEARRQLVETQHRVADVAFASGFGTLGHFNRRFLALTGRTPRQYRNDHRP